MLSFMSLLLRNKKVLCEKKYGQVKIVSVPPEEFLISRRSTDIETAPFICHRVKKTASDLIEEGYSKSVIDSVRTYTASEAEVTVIVAYHTASAAGIKAICS